MIRVSFMYPNNEQKFDYDYYVQKHMVLVHRLLDALGLVRTEVDRGVGSYGGGTPAPYTVIGHLYFRSREDFEAATQSHGKELGADRPNFTNTTPLVQVSEIAG
jgi:uncharacterized protein (TIGR02118 family)